jgi:hypothetical protein
VLRQKMCEKEREGRNVSMAEFRSNLICSINFLSLFLLGGGEFSPPIYCTPARGGGGGEGGVSLSRISGNGPVLLVIHSSFCSTDIQKENVKILGTQ